MPVIWKTYNLGEVAELKNGKSRPEKEGAYPVYGGNGILGYADKFNVDNETIIIGRVGAYCGAVYFESNKSWISDNALYAKTLKGFDSKYLFYLLKYKNLNQYAGGSSHPLLTQGRLNELKVEVPPLHTQRRIASILSALDDKIELNRQTNQTMEAIAQAIFKEWFVDFRFPGATSEMQDSELGHIPKVWRVGKLSDFGNIICGKTPSKANDNFFGGQIPFIKIPDMHNSVFITNTEDSLSEEGAQSQRNKFIPPSSVLVSCIATVGLVAITSEKSQTNQQINAIIPKDEYFSYYLYFCALDLKDVLKDLGSGGSATLNVNTASFANIKCIMPSEEVTRSFDSLTKPIFEEILSIEHQSATLTAIRDALLPKLMNGEIEV